MPRAFWLGHKKSRRYLNLETKITCHQTLDEKVDNFCHMADVPLTKMKTVEREKKVRK